MDIYGNFQRAGPTGGADTVPAISLAIPKALPSLLVPILLVPCLLISFLLLPALVAAADSPPLAVITSPVDDATFVVGEVVTFDGSDSYDDDLTNLTYEWDIGGVVISGKDKAVIGHTFTSPGDLLVVLRVEDSIGQDATASINVHVVSGNVPPQAVISIPNEGQSILWGRPIEFDGSGSWDPDGGPLVFRWEAEGFGDPIEQKAKFTRQLPLGDYHITLIVYDQLGMADTAEVNISVVTNAPPTLRTGAVQPTTGPHDIEDGYNFTVTYMDADNDPPSEILVKVGKRGNLLGHSMTPIDPLDTDYRDGRLYQVKVPLAAGSYSYVFTCKDMFYSCATALHQGPAVHRVEEHAFPDAGAVVTVNWTEVGTVTVLQAPSPGHEPADVVLLSKTYRVLVLDGTWTEARVELTFDLANLVDPETVTLLWYDPIRGIWVPTTGQERGLADATMAGDLPNEDVVMAIYGALSESHQNNPPHLAISYDIKDAYVGERIEFDASTSTDPDGGTLIFYWDFTDDGEPGPWLPGIMANHIFRKEGTHEIALRAIDGQSEHFLYENVSVRAERDIQPGPFDNTGALFMLGSMLVISFGLAIAYRLHKPRTYDDLFGKAYRAKGEDEYSQLFRRLTEKDLGGGWDGAPRGDTGGSEEVEGAPDGEDARDAEDAEDAEDAKDAKDAGDAGDAGVGGRTDRKAD